MAWPKVQLQAQVRRNRRDARPGGSVTKSRAGRDSLDPVLDLGRRDAARQLTCGLGADAVPSHTSRRAAVGLEPAAVLQQQEEGLGLGAEAELARELILRDEVEAVIAEELVVYTPDWGAGVGLRARVWVRVRRTLTLTALVGALIDRLEAAVESGEWQGEGSA